MTLLVGAVGGDGIVLAADTTFLDPPKDDEEIDTKMDGLKIVPIEEHKAAYAFAGDFISQLVGKEFRSKLERESERISRIDLFLEEIANEVMRRELIKNTYLNLNAPRKLLTVFYGEQVAETQLWSLDIRCMNSQAERIVGMVIAGARGNAARFFQKYFSVGLSVKNLKFLAAHIVLAGHSWNGDIDGLEVASFSKSSGFKWTDVKEKKQFIDRFWKLDSITKNVVLGKRIF